VKLEIWSPLPPARSGVADHVAETLPLLVGRAEVGVVVPDPSEVDPAAAAGAALRSPEESDPDAARLYVLGNSRWHSFAYRAALRRPGVLLLHEWSLHGLVFAETFLRGDAGGYRRLMRQAYGTTGAVLAGQVMDGFCSPVIESLFPLSEHLVERSRAVAATTRFTATRAACVRPGLPVGHVPLHAALPIDPLFAGRRDAPSLRGHPAVGPGLVNPPAAGVALRVVSPGSLAGLLFVGRDNPRPAPRRLGGAAGVETTVVASRLSLPDLARISSRPT
jgi:hypothetical protein